MSMHANGVGENQPQATLDYKRKANQHQTTVSAHQRICRVSNSSADIIVFTYARELIYVHASAHTDSMLRTGRMLSTLFLANWVLSLFSVLSSALTPPLSPSSSSSNELSVIDTGSTNGTNLHDLSSPILSYSPECNIIYGHNLNPSSCNNALEKVSRGTIPMAFGQRKTGPWDVLLPRRYLSGTYSWNFEGCGLCSLLQVIHMNRTSLLGRP